MRIAQILGIALTLALHATGTDSKTPIDLLAAQLTGSFSNLAQSKSDQYFKPSIVHSTRFGADREDGIWIYTEHALTGAERHPHKQLVYQLIARTDGSIACKVFDLRDPLGVTGAWQNDALQKLLTPEKLIPRDACSLIFHQREDGSFRGGTEGNGCADLIRGAAYVVTEFIATDRELTIWDRGYTTAGAQVWGHPSSGYAFKRLE